jgi:phage tail sheath gpL-like
LYSQFEIKTPYKMAVGTELISKVVGYKIEKGDFSTSSPNLPMRVLIIGEANHANQATFPNELTEITSAQQAGELYGYGSPIHSMMRILRPSNSVGVGGIPTIVGAQSAAIGATSKIIDVTPIGTATANAVHTLVVAGRQGLDGARYDFAVATGDTTDDITEKMVNAVNAVLSSPITGTDTTYEGRFETKWRGATAQELTITVETNGVSAGITYTVAQDQSGTGTPTVTNTLNLIQNQWVTIVVNGYGLSTAVMTELEDFNGIASPTNPTGRYAGIIFKPFVAVSGSTLENPSSITNPRAAQMTIAVAPAPLSAGFSCEAAANMVAILARQAQDTPHLDASGNFYPDMPTPTSIGAMNQYLQRNDILSKGCSTVELVDGRYRIVDFATTYHPAGETPPQFRYVRSLIQDWNVRFGYFLLEERNVVDHVIANDTDIVTASKVIKPKIWKAIIAGYANDLANRGIIADTPFMVASLQVAISTTNPDRLNTRFSYKRSGMARIASTVATAGFNFGQ